VATTATLDLSQRQIDECCRSGALMRRFVGVYINPGAPPTPLQDLMAAVAAAGRRGAAWGRSAAALWGLGDEFPVTPEVVIPNQRRARIDGVNVHRSSDLCPDHITHRRGIRVTNPLITVLDLGVVLDSEGVGEAIVRGGASRLFAIGAIEATLSRLGRPGRTGIRNVRRAVDLLRSFERPAESVLEYRFLLLAIRYQLPRFSFQHEVRVGRKRYRIDAAYPDVKLAVEIDGYEKRSSPEALVRDAERRNALTLEGWTFLSFPWANVVGDPSRVAEQIVQLLWTLGHQFRG